MEGLLEAAVLGPQGSQKMEASWVAVKEFVTIIQKPYYLRYIHVMVT